MSTFNFRGDPCARCIDEGGIDAADHVQAATHHGLCARHWAGATQQQRADALMEEAMTRSDEPLAPPVTTESIALDLLFGQPCAQPGAEPPPRPDRIDTTLLGLAAYAARVLKDTDGMWPPAARATECRRALRNIEGECRRAHATATTDEGAGR